MFIVIIILSILINQTLINIYSYILAKIYLSISNKQGLCTTFGTRAIDLAKLCGLILQSLPSLKTGRFRVKTAGSVQMDRFSKKPGGSGLKPGGSEKNR